MAIKKAVMPVEEKETTWLPTGSTLMDLVVGAGRGEGWDAGQVINLCAQSGGGKTAIVNETIANARHKYGPKCKWVYDGTTESGNTFDTKALYGFDIIPENPAEVINSETIEEAFGNMMSFMGKLKSDEFGIYALDSIDAVTSAEVEGQVEERLKAHESGKDYDKGSYGAAKCKFLSSVFMPTVAAEAAKHNCLIIIVSQLRDNIGGGLYAPKDKVSNGRALFYYSSAQVWLKTKKDIEKGDRQIGTVLHVTTKKARGPNPYREAMFSFYYSYGIDNIGSNIDYLYDLRTPERGELKKSEAKAIDWDGTVFDRQNLILHIEQNELQDELADRVRRKWNELEKEALSELAERKSRF